ncbi:MAG: T9SS type A sorting domain-containing protein [Chitinophagales bacterium]|nr:T9SS type A sorting domain-containing protein [Chitinophagales bacterium]
MQKHFLLLLFVGSLVLCKASGNSPTPPKSSTVPSSFFLPIPENTLSPLDISETEHLDKVDLKNGELPKFSRSIYTNITLANSGTWSAMPDGGRVWQVKISSQGALALIPFYNKFYLPEGSTLHIYTPDKKEVLGAFTTIDNPANGYYCTGLIHGNACIVEYYEPQHAFGKGELSINEVGYAYRWVKSFDESGRGFGDADACEVNVNCSEGNLYQDPKRSVVRILVQSSGGQGWCSGAMINNVRQDCTPYLLSAQHCSEGTTANQYSQWVFYFNYEAPGCNNPASQGSLATKTVIGCSKIADSNDNGGATGSDFLLLQLNSQPPANYNVFYAGWNANNTASTSGVSIHHPDADIKKISTYTATVVSSKWGNSVNGTHWRVVWAATANGHGVTEPGSSGGPLFNSQGQIIGQLTGGDSYCNTPTAPDLFGKFAYSWTSNGGTATRQLKPWLDPDNTGATTLGGANFPCGTLQQNDAGIQTIETPSGNLCNTLFSPVLILKNFGGNALTSVTINYSIDGNVYQHNWTGNLSALSVTTVTLPPVTLNPGTHSFSAETNNPNGVADNNTSNDGVSATFNIAPPSGLLNLYLKPDIYGSETTWTIKDGNNNVAASGGPYTDSFNPQAMNIPVCLPLGCYTLTLYDEYGDGMGSNVNGQMKLTGQSGTITYAQLTNPDFGDSVSFNFCIQGTGISETANQLSVRVSPNPSTAMFYISIVSEELKTIRVFDIVGKEVINLKTNTGSFTIDLAGESKGIYLLQIESDSGIAIHRLVKE